MHLFGGLLGSSCHLPMWFSKHFFPKDDNQEYLQMSPNVLSSKQTLYPKGVTLPPTGYFMRGFLVNFSWSDVLKDTPQNVASPRRQTNIGWRNERMRGLNRYLRAQMRSESKGWQGREEEPHLKYTSTVAHSLLLCHKGTVSFCRGHKVWNIYYLILYQNICYSSFLFGCVQNENPR